jgi:hypothetical protein
LNGLTLGLPDSYDSNAQLMSLPLNTFSTAGANAYLLDDTNDLYPNNYSTTVNPPVVTSSSLSNSAYSTVLSNIPTTVPTTSALYDANDFPSPPEEANNWSATFDQIIYDMPNPTTPDATLANTTPTLPSQKFVFTPEYFDVSPELNPQQIHIESEFNAPLTSSISKIEKEKKEDTSFVIPKKEEPRSSEIATEILPQKVPQKKQEVALKFENKKVDEMLDQISKSLYDIDLNDSSVKDNDSILKAKDATSSFVEDNVLRAKHAAIVLALYEKINQLSKKFDETKEIDNSKVKIEAQVN